MTGYYLVSVLFFTLVVWNERETNGMLPSEESGSLVESMDSPSLGTAVVSTQILTIFNYDNNQVYVYAALSNENENVGSPQKWIFYFVPIMLPEKNNNNDDKWLFSSNNEVHMKLILSSANIVEIARKAIVAKYDLSISQYAKFWTVAPLMIDSMMAWIVKGSNSPVEGVHPFRIINPNTLTMQLWFRCSSSNTAELIVDNILDGYYEVELAFYFSGFKQITMNMISITGDQLKNVLSKTTADGGSKNAKYIHRNQGSSFVSKYVTNVKKMIYMENVNSNISSLAAGLEDQFTSLLQQGMAYSNEAKVDAKLYDQVWSSADLNPDRITNELKKLFTYNQTATQRHNYSDNYFDFNQAYAQASSASGSGSFNILSFFSGGGGGGSSGSSSNHLLTTTQSIFSATEIQNLLTQESVETEWMGEKFIPKSFSVYKLTDIADWLQVAIIAKQLIAEKSNGAIVRTVNTRSSTLLPSIRPSVFAGEIKLYSSNASSLPESWIFCHGQALSRIEYQRLFSVIGEKFGAGNGKTTFNIPNFRGSSTQTLTVAQIPTHQHNKGTLSADSSGSHVHSINDAGHNHGGSTDTRPGGGGRFNLKSNGGGHFDDGNVHSHTIPTGHTGISILAGGLHGHSISGSTDYAGYGQSFSIMPPYQTVDFIIYTGD
ncbi:unnamed protein product [Rotaria socialis]|uniref:Phage tail collar domain-containing protein n=1 Tax=Rotaria socialis TaxID=392032 RepID=A0A817SIJ8_9BILA|nr:unnamed protein product [Rotaria socialis]CAF4469335.1 unnamed protein product [Rotaria socialis]